MELPTRFEVEEHIKRSVAIQKEWAVTAFELGYLEFDLAFQDHPNAPTGLATFDGGTMGLNINYYLVTRFPLIGFSEYSRVSKHWRTCSFKTTDWKLYLDTLVAHEMSHLVSYRFRVLRHTHPWYIGTDDIMIFKDLGHWEGSHGEFFCAVYAKIRDKFVNQRVSFSAMGDIPSSFDSKAEMLDLISDRHVVTISDMSVTIKGTNYTVVGRNPKRSKLYRFQIRDIDGEFYRVKLATLARCSDEIANRINLDENLRLELTQNILDIEQST